MHLGVYSVHTHTKTGDIVCRSIWSTKNEFCTILKYQKFILPKRYIPVKNVFVAKKLHAKWDSNNNFHNPRDAEKFK